jgi:hypothetical protein
LGIRGEEELPIASRARGRKRKRKRKRRMRGNSKTSKIRKKVRGELTLLRWISITWGLISIRFKGREQEKRVG